MATHPKSYLTPEQYLEIERKAEFKSEYYQGEMFAMSGAREGHNLIVWNLAAELHRQLRKKPLPGLHKRYARSCKRYRPIHLPGCRRRLRRAAIPRRKPRYAPQSQLDRDRK